MELKITPFENALIVRNGNYEVFVYDTFVMVFKLFKPHSKVFCYNTGKIEVIEDKDDDDQ